MELTQRAATVLDEAELWRCHSPRIYRYLWRLTGDRQTTEDLTQETFLQAIRDLRRTPVPGERVEGWLFRIAANRATDHFRRKRRFSWLPFLTDRDGAAVPDAAEILAEQDLVCLALRRLPPETASLLLMKDGEGFSTREIAELMDQNYEALRKRLSRARESFRVEYLRLKGECDG